MNKKYILLLSILMLLSIGAFQPFGCKNNVEGTVTDHRNRLAIGAIVSINIDGYEPVTVGTDGRYIIKDVPYGDYILTATYGDESVTQAIKTTYLEDGIGCEGSDRYLWLNKDAGYNLIKTISNTHYGDSYIACNDDYIYLSDVLNNKIKKYDYEGNLLDSVDVTNTFGIVVKSTNVYIKTYNTIKRYNSDLVFQSEVSISTNGDEPFVIDDLGNYYTANGSFLVQKYDSTGSKLFEFGEVGEGEGQFGLIGGIAIDSTGKIYVADSQGVVNNARYQVFNSSGNYLSSTNIIDSWGNIRSINEVAIGSDDTLYIAADGITSRFYVKETTETEPINGCIESDGLGSTSGGSDSIAVSPSGKVVVTDDPGNSIHIYSK